MVRRGVQFRNFPIWRGKKISFVDFHNGLERANHYIVCIFYFPHCPVRKIAAENIEKRYCFSRGVQFIAIYNLLVHNAICV